MFAKNMMFDKAKKKYTKRFLAFLKSLTPFQGELDGSESVPVLFSDDVQTVPFSNFMNAGGASFSLYADNHINFWHSINIIEDFIENGGLEVLLTTHVPESAGAKVALFLFQAEAGGGTYDISYHPGGATSSYIISWEPIAQLSDGEFKSFYLLLPVIDDRVCFLGEPGMGAAVNFMAYLCGWI